MQVGVKMLHNKIKKWHDIYQTQCDNVNKMFRQSQMTYYSEKIMSEREPKIISKLKPSGMIFIWKY